ncbi:hypothetical protein PUN28_012580 [Cardiocondyla obscurior]|uniref:Uncharacterized protein n=1 Tax=Cardiocondyla obscurior TaxID=286306 RepID=A0AAW2FG18_9HYME
MVATSVRCLYEGNPRKAKEPRRGMTKKKELLEDTYQYFPFRSYIFFSRRIRGIITTFRSAFSSGDSFAEGPSIESHVSSLLLFLALARVINVTGGKGGGAIAVVQRLPCAWRMGSRLTDFQAELLASRMQNARGPRTGPIDFREPSRHGAQSERERDRRQFRATRRSPRQRSWFRSFRASQIGNGKPVKCAWGVNAT